MHRNSAYPCYVQTTSLATEKHIKEWLSSNGFSCCWFYYGSTPFIFVSKLGVAYGYKTVEGAVHDNGECCGQNVTLFKSICMQIPSVTF